MIGLKATLLLLLCQVIQQATAECMVYTCPAKCYKGLDSNGCVACNCDNTCRVTRCPGGYKCIVSPFSCETYPCNPQPECVVNDYACSDKRSRVRPDNCIMAEDSMGCEIWHCGDTCRNVECPEGQKCVAFKHGFRPSSIPTPGCVPDDYAATEDPITTTECPMVTCPDYCPQAVDYNGCNTCSCENTCRTTECPEGYNCVMIYNGCPEKPCYSKPRCFPDYVVAAAEDPTATTGTTENPTTTTEPRTCPSPVQCEEPCVADLGPDGCYSKCSCPETCRDKQCKADEVCELVQVYCIRAPCFPVPTCFPKNRTCSQSPNADRCSDRYRTRWTYNSNTNACETFSYYGCTPSPNTFKSRKDCEDLCVQSRSCPPEREMCMKNCYWGQRTAETCPECICPCWTVRCLPNTECRLREGDCSRGEPCRPTAYCAPVPEVTCGPVCARYCPYGNVKDPNGCDTCECNSAPTTSYDEAQPF